MSRPIIVIGAPRSGTKMLRGLIGSHRDVAEVPYDINFVWKYGNYTVPHDELQPADGNPAAARFIRRYLAKQENGMSRVVEKTVCNALRVDYVRAVLPGCQFVHLIRDGRDVAASTMRQWQGGTDWRQVLAKAPVLPDRRRPPIWKRLRTSAALASSCAVEPLIMGRSHA